MYTAFASVYDKLMIDVNYTRWAHFYHEIIEKEGLGRGKVCECACGTGSITIPLSKLGYQMTGVDISSEMLFEASQKARKVGAMIPFVKQDMRNLRLHRQMDVIICSNDGINYLKNDEVFSFFQASYQALRLGGLLIMDVSTPYKIQHVLGNYFIGDETEEIAYLWQNSYHPNENCVDLNLAIFVKQSEDVYKRIEEHQRQYAHERLDITQLLTEAGFRSIQFFADKHFAPPGAKETRWFVCAQKPHIIPIRNENKR